MPEKDFSQTTPNSIACAKTSSPGDNNYGGDVHESKTDASYNAIT